MTLSASSRLADHAVSPRFVWDDHTDTQVPSGYTLYGQACDDAGAPLAGSHPFRGLVAPNGHLGSFQTLSGTTWRDAAGDAWLHGTTSLKVKIIAFSPAEERTRQLAREDVQQMLLDAPQAQWSNDSSSARQFSADTHAFHGYRSPKFLRAAGAAVPSGWVLYGKMGSNPAWRATMGHYGRIARLQIYRDLHVQTQPLVASAGGSLQILAFDPRRDPNPDADHVEALIAQAPATVWHADAIQLQPSGMPYPEYRPDHAQWPHLSDAFRALRGPTGLVTVSQPRADVHEKFTTLHLAGICKDYFDSRLVPGSRYWNPANPPHEEYRNGIVWDNGHGSALYTPNGILSLTGDDVYIDGDNGFRHAYDQARQFLDAQWRTPINTAASRLHGLLNADFRTELNSWIATGTEAAAWAMRFLGEILSTLHEHLHDEEAVDHVAMQVAGRETGDFHSVNEALAAMAPAFNTLRQHVDEAVSHHGTVPETLRDGEHEYGYLELVKGLIEGMTGAIEIHGQGQLAALRAAARDEFRVAAATDFGTAIGEMDAFLDRLFGTGAHGMFAHAEVGHLEAAITHIPATATTPSEHVASFLASHGAASDSVIFLHADHEQSERLEELEQQVHSSHTQLEQDLGTAEAHTGTLTAPLELMSRALVAWNCITSIRVIALRTHPTSLTSASQDMDAISNFATLAQGITEWVISNNLGTAARTAGRALTAEEAEVAAGTLLGVSAETIARSFCVIATLASLGSSLVKLIEAIQSGDTRGMIENSFALVGGLISGLGMWLGVETVLGVWCFGIGLLISLSVIAALAAYDAWRDEHYGRGALAMEAFKRRLVLSTPYAKEDKRRLALVRVRLTPTPAGGGLIEASSPAEFPSHVVSQLIAHQHSASIACVLRLPRHYRQGESTGDGRYEHENPEGHTAAPRFLLALGSAPAAGNPNIFRMAPRTERPGTWAWVWHPRPFTLLEYRPYWYGDHHTDPEHFTVNWHAGDTVNSADATREELERARRILTAPENLTKAIPVLAEVFLFDDSTDLLFGGLRNYYIHPHPVGAAPSCGISEILFLRRTSADLAAPMQLIGETEAQAAGIVEVDFPAHAGVGS